MLKRWNLILCSLLAVAACGQGMSDPDMREPEMTEPKMPDPSDEELEAMASDVVIGESRDEVIEKYGEPFHKQAGNEAGVYCELYPAGAGAEDVYILEVLYRNDVVINRRMQISYGIIHCEPLESAYVYEN